MRQSVRGLFYALAFAGTGLSPGTAAAQTPPVGTEVDLELILAVDISGSMEFDEAVTQRRGYIDALRHPDVIEAIQSGLLGQIALTYVEWAGPTIQFTRVPWTVIDGPEAADRVAEAIEQVPLFQFRGTAIANSLLFSSSLFEDNGFEGLRQVIDISGDGPNNMGLSVAYVRDLILARGITINGLPIMLNPSGIGLSMYGLDVYYEDCVIGGPGAFIIPVDSAENFAEAIRRKLVLEIAAIVPDDRYTVTPVQSRAARVDCFIGERMRGFP